jgi:hypothetical protein
MYPHTATIWNKTETGDHATWARSVLPEVRFESLRGSRRLANGDGSLDAVLVIVPFREGISFASKDRIAEGDITDVEPPEAAHHITAVDPISRGTSAIHHWEVTGK